MRTVKPMKGLIELPDATERAAVAARAAVARAMEGLPPGSNVRVDVPVEGEPGLQYTETGAKIR